MTIYCLIVEAIPDNNNVDEREKYGGAYINCWVKASTSKQALNKGVLIK